jgi:hypothetical protein
VNLDHTIKTTDEDVYETQTDRHIETDLILAETMTLIREQHKVKVKVDDLCTAVSYIICTSRAVYRVGNLQVRLTYIWNGAYGCPTYITC